MTDTMRRRRSAGGDSQYSETLGENKLVGDVRQRVTVPMPKNLREVEQHADRHFRGHKGMFHHGKHKMHKEHHVGPLKDGDVVILRRGTPRQVEPPVMSTAQEHFVQHPLEAKRAAPPREQPVSNCKFEGMSAYHADYVAHPLEARKPAPAPPSNWNANRHLDPTGPSTYQQEYPAHDVSRPQLTKPMQGSYYRDTAPFEGVSSYHADYIKHNVRPRTAGQARAPQREMTPGPFEGYSTYNQDFIRHPVSPRKPQQTDYTSTLNRGTQPFEGMTEYTREYLKHDMQRQRQPVIHIEPEITRRRRSSAAALNQRPGSAPAARRGAR